MVDGYIIYHPGGRLQYIAAKVVDKITVPTFLGEDVITKQQYVVQHINDVAESTIVHFIDVVDVIHFTRSRDVAKAILKSLN